MVENIEHRKYSAIFEIFFYHNLTVLIEVYAVFASYFCYRELTQADLLNLNLLICKPVFCISN